MLALVMSGMIAASVPAPSPRSAFRSIDPPITEPNGGPGGMSWSLNEQRREYQRDRREELHEDVQAGSGGVLEGIPHGVADDRGGMRGRPFPDYAPLLVVQLAELDELLGVVPSPAAVVQYRGEDHPGHRADHQHRRFRLR